MYCPVGLYNFVTMTPYAGTSVPKHVGVYIFHKWCITECLFGSCIVCKNMHIMNNVNFTVQEVRPERKIIMNIFRLILTIIGTFRIQLYCCPTILHIVPVTNERFIMSRDEHLYSISISVRNHCVTDVLTSRSSLSVWPRQNLNQRQTYVMIAQRQTEQCARCSKISLVTKLYNMQSRLLSDGRVFGQHDLNLIHILNSCERIALFFMFEDAENQITSYCFIMFLRNY